jgi:excisionase family DNA binding protein
VKHARQFESLEHAAERLDVSERTIRRYVSTGRLTGYRTGPRLLRVDRAEVDAMLEPIPTVAPRSA